jgi:hypothetical protein
MPSFTDGPAREQLSERTRLDAEQVARLRASGTLVVDDRRRRPRYFDGRFLAARDLTREQGYFLARQADLGRAAGAGVVHGLGVREGADGAQLVIGAGHGVTPAGEPVILDAPLTVRLNDVPEIQRLDVAFGLATRPSEPARSRSGLFVVALRPVEYTASPIASYPTSVTDRRTVEDGDIVEATAVTLIPFDVGGDAELTRRRAHAARSVFVLGDGEATLGGRRRMPVDALPLAVVALDRGIVRWIDLYLARREAGMDDSPVLGLDRATRPLREAHLQQYDAHLTTVLAERERSGRGWRFAAGEHFAALPAAGRMPAAAIDPAGFTQSFFPGTVSAELSVVPVEEVPALVEESLRLPPIDLEDAEALETLSVLVLLPVPSARLRALRATLERLARPLLPAVPTQLARRLPLDVLRGLKAVRIPPPPVRPESLADAAWAAALADSARAGQLWYVRRRNVSVGEATFGVAVRLTGDESRDEITLDERLRDAGVVTRVSTIRKAATAQAGAEIVTLLGAPSLGRSPLLLRAALDELDAAREARTAEQPTEANAKLDRASVLRVAERFADPELGEGLKRLSEAEAELGGEAVTNELAKAGAIPEVDRAARTLPPEQLREFATALSTAATSGDRAAVSAVVARFGGRMGGGPVR